MSLSKDIQGIDLDLYSGPMADKKPLIAIKANDIDDVKMDKSRVVL